MSTEFFKNGNKLVAKLTVSKVAWGCTVIVLTQIQGYLPSLDFLSSRALKLLAFGIAVILSCAKGAEMFFDRTTQLFKNHDISVDETTQQQQIAIENETKTTVITEPVSTNP